jgi:hypothetical protein
MIIKPMKASAYSTLLMFAMMLPPSISNAQTVAMTKIADQKRAQNLNWTTLLDKDLKKWGNYLAFNHKPDYNGKPPADENGTPIEPIGYNKDTKGVFTVVEENGGPVLKVSGEVYGCLYTNEEYENFHLKLQVKWGTKAYGPRVGKLKDSGILYFSQGPSGVDYWRAWMLSQEFQIMEGHTGDYWNISTSAADIRAFLPEGKMNSIADTNQPFLHFGTGAPEGLCIRNENHEKPGNDWNTVELICYQGKSLHIVNGHVVMVLKNSHYVQNGKQIPLVKGKVQLQSEGSEVYFKGVQIRDITSMPEQYQVYYN